MPTPYDIESLESMFTAHRPDPDDLEKHNRIRNAARVLAQTILEVTPRCADQSAAIRHVREAVMTANAAVALKGLV